MSFYSSSSSALTFHSRMKDYSQKIASQKDALNKSFEEAMSKISSPKSEKKKKIPYIYVNNYVIPPTPNQPYIPFDKNLSPSKRFDMRWLYRTGKLSADEIPPFKYEKIDFDMKFSSDEEKDNEEVESKDNNSDNENINANNANNLEVKNNSNSNLNDDLNKSNNSEDLKIEDLDGSNNDLVQEEEEEVNDSETSDKDLKSHTIEANNNEQKDNLNLFEEEEENEKITSNPVKSLNSSIDKPGNSEEQKNNLILIEEEEEENEKRSSNSDISLNFSSSKENNNEEHNKFLISIKEEEEEIFDDLAFTQLDEPVNLSNNQNEEDEIDEKNQDTMIDKKYGSSGMKMSTDLNEIFNSSSDGSNVADE